MRRNEEMIRKHVVSQDEEIRAHRLKYEALNGEKARWQSRVAELEAEMVMIKNAFKDKADEGNKSANDLKSLMLAKEKAELDLKSAKDHVRELEETLLAKRKEKDLLMTTYCRVIKDNEKLHSDLQKLHEDFLATKAGDLQSETAMKAFQTKIQVQSQELDRFKSQLGQAEGRINELESRLQDSQRSSKRLEDEVRDKEREIRSLKGIIESLEKSKRDIAGQLARFGQQANELRGHLRRMEDEKSDLQSKLKSSTMDSPANRNLQNQIVALTMDLDQSKSQLRTLEREKETLSHQAKLEKLKATQMEEMMKGERSKRLEKESIIADLERTRSKLKGHFDILNEEHNKGVLSMKKQIQATRDENERLKRSERRMNFDFDRRFGGGRHTTPSPPDSPVEGDMILPKTEKLRAQNQMLKKNLRDIQKEIKQNMSPGKFIDPELETSIVALTSEEADESSSPTSDEIVSSNAEIRKRLEKENALLVKIVEKVKNDLMKAGLDTPMSISSNI